MKCSRSAGTTSRRRRSIGWRSLSSEYGLGLQIQQVQLATVRPPPVVQAAFNEVNQAQQEKQTAINQAWAIYNDAVPNARGQAKEREKQAEAYAFRRVNQAKGDAEKFSLLLAEYRKAPEITRRRLYLESMESILPALAKKGHRGRQHQRHSANFAASPAGRRQTTHSPNHCGITRSSFQHLPPARCAFCKAAA